MDLHYHNIIPNPPTYVEYGNFSDDESSNDSHENVAKPSGTITTAQLAEGIKKSIGMKFVLMETRIEVRKILHKRLMLRNQLNCALNTYMHEYFVPEVDKCKDEISKFLENVDNISDFDVKKLMFLLLKEMDRVHSYRISAYTLFSVLKYLFTTVHESCQSNVAKYLVECVMDMQTMLDNGEVSFPEIDEEYMEYRAREYGRFYFM